MRQEQFYYSKEIKGNAANYHWKVSFDKSTSGYLGISQRHESGELERVLLTPRQVKEMLAFIKRIDTRKG